MSVPIIVSAVHCTVKPLTILCQTPLLNPEGTKPSSLPLLYYGVHIVANNYLASLTPTNPGWCDETLLSFTPRLWKLKWFTSVSVGCRSWFYVHPAFTGFYLSVGPYTVIVLRSGIFSLSILRTDHRPRTRAEPENCLLTTFKIYKKKSTFNDVTFADSW